MSLSVRRSVSVESHNFPHPGRLACSCAPNSRPPANKALHTICGNNTSTVSSPWWWAYKCPKHVEQIMTAIKHSVASSRFPYPRSLLCLQDPHLLFLYSARWIQSTSSHWACLACYLIIISHLCLGIRIFSSIKNSDKNFYVSDFWADQSRDRGPVRWYFQCAVAFNLTFLQVLYRIYFRRGWRKSWSMLIRGADHRSEHRTDGSESVANWEMLMCGCGLCMFWCWYVSFCRVCGVCVWMCVCVCVCMCIKMGLE